MAAPNEVRFNIRHNVLFLKTFTVPQLQAITGLNRQSIHTEIRRMEQEGLVSRVGTEEVSKGSAGGRPPVIYQLTPDPEKRFELLQSVRAFYVAVEEKASELPRPESKHYFIAKEILEESVEKGTPLAQDEKVARLDLIKKRLEYARQEEEVGEEGTQLIAASFDILEAKAIDALAGDWEQAVKLLDGARRVCQQFGATDLVGEIRAHVQTMVTRMVDAQLESDDSQEYAKVEEIAKHLGIIKHRFDDWPEISICLKQAERLAEKARERQISTLVKKEAAQQIQLFATALNQSQTVLIAQMPGAAEEPRYVSEASFESQSLPVETHTPITSILLQLLQDEEVRSYGAQFSRRRRAGMTLRELFRNVLESEG
jgi:predicted ArsR family transcriptional regulator